MPPGEGAIVSTQNRELPGQSKRPGSLCWKLPGKAWGLSTSQWILRARQPQRVQGGDRRVCGCTLAPGHQHPTPDIPHARVQGRAQASSRPGPNTLAWLCDSDIQGYLCESPGAPGCCAHSPSSYTATWHFCGLCRPLYDPEAMVTEAVWKPQSKCKHGRP